MEVELGLGRWWLGRLDGLVGSPNRSRSGDVMVLVLILVLILVLVLVLVLVLADRVGVLRKGGCAGDSIWIGEERSCGTICNPISIEKDSRVCNHMNTYMLILAMLLCLLFVMSDLFIIQIPNYSFIIITSLEWNWNN